MTSTYVGKKIALKTLGISHSTLLKLESNNKIEIIKTMGGHRKYNVAKYIDDHKKPVDYVIKNNQPVVIDPKDIVDEIKIEKMNICYVRVSSLGQKDDLQRQKEYMQKKYPTYTLIEDIGSGLNFNRKGLRKIVRWGIEGKINNVVVAYKDRLTRFGFEFIEDLIKEYSKGSVTIENDKNRDKDPQQEMVEDVLQILNIYTAKMNGMRKYKKNQDKKDLLNKHLPPSPIPVID